MGLQFLLPFLASGLSLSSGLYPGGGAILRLPGLTSLGVSSLTGIGFLKSGFLKSNFLGSLFAGRSSLVFL